MRKLTKKLLACCLVFALALTMCAGVFSVSAASTGTLTVGTVSVAANAGTVTVPVTLATEHSNGFAMATYSITVPEALRTITAVAVSSDSTTNPASVSYADAEGNVVTVANGASSTTAPAIDTNGVINFKVDCTDILATGPKSVVVNITFDISALSAIEVATDYDITVGDVVAADNGYVSEDDTDNIQYIEVSGVAGKVTVAPAAVEAVLDSELKFRIVAANIQDSLGLACTIDTRSYADYASYEVVFTTEKYDTSRDLYVADPVTMQTTALSYYQRAVFSGIAMFEIDRPIKAVIKAYDADGNYVAYSQEFTYVLSEIAKDTYRNATKDAAKAQITDMLNLATEAQKYFGNAAKSTNPDNDLLKAEPINKDWDQSLATEGTKESIVEKLNLVNSTVWADDAPLTSLDIGFVPAINYAATPTISYRINDAQSKYSENDFRLEISYTAVYPKGIAGLKTQTVANEGWDVLVNGRYKRVNFNGMTLADTNCEVTAKLYYKDQLVLTNVFTMEQGINSTLNSSSGGDLSLALAKFGMSSREYFK